MAPSLLTAMPVVPGRSRTPRIGIGAPIPSQSEVRHSRRYQRQRCDQFGMSGRQCGADDATERIANEMHRPVGPTADQRCDEVGVGHQGIPASSVGDPSGRVPADRPGTRSPTATSARPARSSFPRSRRDRVRTMRPPRRSRLMSPGRSVRRTKTPRPSTISVQPSGGSSATPGMSPSTCAITAVVKAARSSRAPGIPGRWRGSARVDPAVMNPWCHSSP